MRLRVLAVLLVSWGSARADVVNYYELFQKHFEQTTVSAQLDDFASSETWEGNCAVHGAPTTYLPRMRLSVFAVARDKIIKKARVSFDVMYPWGTFTQGYDHVQEFKPAYYSSQSNSLVQLAPKLGYWSELRKMRDEEGVYYLLKVTCQKTCEWDDDRYDAGVVAAACYFRRKLDPKP